VTQVSATT